MTPRFKYPRTAHLPWSLAKTSDDIDMGDSVLPDCTDIVVTEKMDGENTTIYSDLVHARSIDGRHHPSRDWVKQLQGRIGYEIPEGWRLCGENLYAQHSLVYENLESYFYLFSVWNEENVCLDWDDQEDWAELLGLVMPKVLYRGPWDEKLLKKLADDLDTEVTEGYVVRTAEGFHHSRFSEHLAKWVRAHHVQTDKHWMHQAVVPNGLADE